MPFLYLIKVFLQIIAVSISQSYEDLEETWQDNPLPNIYRWIAENSHICSLKPSAESSFIFFDERSGVDCQVCPKYSIAKFPQMACAVKIWHSKGQTEVVCHESKRICTGRSSRQFFAKYWWKLEILITSQFIQLSLMRRIKRVPSLCLSQYKILYENYYFRMSLSKNTLDQQQFDNSQPKITSTTPNSIFIANSKTEPINIKTGAHSLKFNPDMNDLSMEIFKPRNVNLSGSKVEENLTTSTEENLPFKITSCFLDIPSCNKTYFLAGNIEEEDWRNPLEFLRTTTSPPITRNVLKMPYLTYSTRTIFQATTILPPVTTQKTTWRLIKYSSHVEKMDPRKNPIERFRFLQTKMPILLNMETDKKQVKNYERLKPKKKNIYPNAIQVEGEAERIDMDIENLPFEIKEDVDFDELEQFDYKTLKTNIISTSPTPIPISPITLLNITTTSKYAFVNATNLSMPVTSKTSTTSEPIAESQTPSKKVHNFDYTKVINKLSSMHVKEPIRLQIKPKKNLKLNYINKKQKNQISRPFLHVGEVVPIGRINRLRESIPLSSQWFVKIKHNKLHSIKVLSKKITTSTTPRPSLTTRFYRFNNTQCLDSHQLCSFWAKLYECEKNLFWMKTQCPKSCGYCVENNTSDKHMDLINIKVESQQGCVNSHKNCEFWKNLGECERNPTWMKKHCRFSCICSASSY